MKNIFKYIIVAMLFTTPSCAQKSIRIPGAFVETTPPLVPSNEWQLLNASNKEFRVRNFEGSLKIDRTTEINWSLLDIPGGRLKGVDHGEFGGSLTFTPNENFQQLIEIKEGHIRFVFNFHNKVYFIEGNTHMGFIGGALYELTRTDGIFGYKKLLDFEDAPEALTIYKDQLLIAGYQSFYTVKNLKTEIILKKTFWTGLYPNSIAAFDDQNVFIGMRGGIVKLDLTEDRVVFYKND